MDRLAEIAEQVWGLEVQQALPVTESFGSDVLLFDATDGERYVIKNSFSPSKGRREVEALEALAFHHRVPALLDHRLIAEEMYLLIEGLPGTPWTSIVGSSPALLRAIGLAMRHVHSVRYGSFDAASSWHELLRHNADGYRAAIGSEDRDLADQALAAFERRLPHVPDSTEPVLVQFDLRPGNILTRAGEFVALIDFESARGGHPSMDFFKFWQQVEPLVPGAMGLLLDGYRSAPTRSSQNEPPEAWAQTDQLDKLMMIYSLYHGLAGLSWCYTRDDFSGHFPDTNRALITTALNPI